MDIGISKHDLQKEAISLIMGLDETKLSAALKEFLECIDTAHSTA